jgi:taurine dioxygenase
MTLTIRPLPEVLGAEITGVDLGQPLTEADFAPIRSALADRQVLVFRDQRITPEQQIAFSRRFGPLEIHVQHHFHLPGHPEILIVSNVIEDGKPIGLADAGRYWHSDLSYLREPSLGSLLHAQELPAEGGDTLFCTMFGAYEALPEDLRHRIDGLEAVHDYGARNRKQREASALRPGLTPEQENRVPPIVHPVVRVHPANGRKALFVNEGFTTHIVGLPEEESATLLTRLFQHSVEDQFIYRHRWQPFDLVMWDNRSTQHLATGCPPHLRRTLYRTTVRGDQPVGVAVEHEHHSASSLAIQGV